jgi:gliding motility associated protien GldN
VLDGVYIKEHLDKKRPVPYTHLREADVMWSKRIWRTMDLREKINHPFYYPTDETVTNRKCLFNVIKYGLMTTGELTAYANPVFDDEFKVEMTPSEVKMSLSYTDTVYTPDLETGELIKKIIPMEIDAEKVKRYWIKEDWFFDKQRSVLDVRIIGIAPMREKIDKSTGEFRGFEPLFWVYFPQCRKVFARYEVFNRKNDAERRTYDEIFHKRLFSSFIHKEANVYDRVIMDYAQGLEALLESDRIKEKIFNLEHDMWHL